ncbi:MAG: hypothetical protein D5R96_01160 [Methanocalculus sp. MSAO_Arc2]|nr:MAG: hypothetical protein D5R96_01160 [Methanocalculus sp. MSAO_Arc2]
MIHERTRKKSPSPGIKTVVSYDFFSSWYPRMDGFSPEVDGKPYFKKRSLLFMTEKGQVFDLRFMQISFNKPGLKCRCTKGDIHP